MSNPAEGYESYMVPSLFGPWARRLVDSVPPRADDRVLDLACGTGVVAREVASRVATARIAGIDLNPHMLEVARAASEREGISIEFREGRAEALPFPERSFDLALCQFALMFMDDRRGALAELHRVLAPGGRLGLSVWQGLERHPFYEMLDRVIERRAGISALRSIFALGDEAELRDLVEGAGFAHVAIEAVSVPARFPNPAGFLAGEIELDTAAIPAMQHLDERERRAITDAISDEMQGPLREVTHGDHVVIPFHARIARAERV
jgi:ubiquinone/menaquinone biosynthesis C-methylase UbiE